MPPHPPSPPTHLLLFFMCSSRLMGGGGGVHALSRHTMHMLLAGFAGAREATVFGAHVATKGRPGYRAPAPHLTKGAPALPTDVQALSQLVAQQVIQQLWGVSHLPPYRPPVCPPIPVTLHMGWAADQGSLAPMPAPP